MGAKCDFLFTLISFILNLGDIATLIMLLHEYYTNGHTDWFTFTLVVFLVPSLLVNCFSVAFFVWDATEDIPPWQWTIRIIVAILQLSTPFRYGFFLNIY